MGKDRNKRMISILMTLTIIFTLMGGTLSYLRWQTSEAQKTNVVFTVTSNYSCAADGGGDIASATLMPASCTNQNYAIQKEVTVTPTMINGLGIAMDLWLDINELGSGLSQSEYFRYALTTVENDCTSGIITQGTFTGLSSENDDKVILLDGRHYNTSEPQTYYLYIWIDPLEENNYIVDQKFNFSLGGMCSELYTISYDLNGGEGNIETQYKSNNKSVFLTNEIPARTGYIFLGWSSTPAAITPEYQAGEEYMIDKSIMLYAIWDMLSPLESYSCTNSNVGVEPYMFTYTGDCEVIDDGDGNWRIKFLTNGTLISNIDIIIDAFLVGGGGSGGSRSSSSTQKGSGGGGGYTTTSKSIGLISGKSYNIVIGLGGSSVGADSNGKSGESTTAFNLEAKGGSGGVGNTVGVIGGNGGSGGGGGGDGVGGSDGSNGGTGGTYGGGSGQGVTTCEFRETGCTVDKLYAGGGGGANNGAGGLGGGANAGVSASPNTGGGGGGSGGGSSGAGGSGIVVIRNSNFGCFYGDDLDKIETTFTYTGNCEMIDDGNGDWRIKFLTSGTYITNTNIEIDAFLVGGGGSGGSRTSSTNAWGGGGGGGYTVTSKNITLTAKTPYIINIGFGGASVGVDLNGNSGGSTTAFELIANGGLGGIGNTLAVAGGSGGSGGGGGGGGNGGSNGTAGGSGFSSGGSGQETTTCEFGEIGCPSEKLYAGGGGGGKSGKGGLGGGADGETSASPNTGGGGGGSGIGISGAGGSGIVVIRKSK